MNRLEQKIKTMILVIMMNNIFTENYKSDEEINELFESEKLRIENLSDSSDFGKTLWNYYQFMSFAKWFPDLFLDLYKSKDSNMHLHYDQRVFMRADLRFFSMYGTFARSYGKTFLEVADDVVAAILYPGIDIAITAQTRENAATIMADKINDLLKYFPLLKNEIADMRFSKNDAFVKFKNDSTISNLANGQSSKGRRMHRIKIEESALLNNTLFEDVLEPIPGMPRITAGSLGISDPEEMNFQIHFLTTSGYRGSDEYGRNMDMIDEMRNLKGKIVLGSNWMLPCYYGRGKTKNQILKKKKSITPISFDQNYEEKWVGCSNNALVDINKLIACRTIEEPTLEIQKHGEEYYVGVDVARSENTGNNQSAIAVIKVIRNKITRRVTTVEVVNVYGVSNKMNFRNQAITVKKFKRAYKAKMVICDGNGLGAGLVDELLQEQIDPITGEVFGCLDTVNTDNKPASRNADKCLFDMKAQGYQTKVLSHFIGSVDNGILHMLIKKEEQKFTDAEHDLFDKNVMPFVNTELLFNEIANLKLKVKTGSALDVEKVVRKIDKDRFSALSYALFYVFEFKNNFKQSSDESAPLSFQMRNPNIRRI